MASVSEEDEEFYFLDQFNFDQRDCFVPNKKSSYMKYTKIPSCGLDVRLRSKSSCWQQNPKVRKHVAIETDIKDTTRSLKFYEVPDNKRIVQEDIKKKVDKSAIVLKKPNQRPTRKFWCSTNRASQADDKIMTSTDLNEKRSSTSSVKYSNNIPLVSENYDSQFFLNGPLFYDVMGKSKSFPLQSKNTNLNINSDVDVNKKNVSKTQSDNIPNKKRNKLSNKQQKVKDTKYTETRLTYNCVDSTPLISENIEVSTQVQGESVRRYLDDIVEDSYSERTNEIYKDRAIHILNSSDNSLHYSFKTSSTQNSKDRISGNEFTKMEDFAVQRDFSSNTELLQVSVSTSTRKEVSHAFTNKADENSDVATNTETNVIHTYTNTEKKEINAFTNTENDKVNAPTNTEDSCCENSFIQPKLFDNLNIPDVSLTFDKSIKLVGTSVSLPNLLSSKRPCPTDMRLPKCPISVVSVFKTVMENRKDEALLPFSASMKKTNESKSNCSFKFSSYKIVNPSDLIGGVKFNTGLLSSDVISDQFKMELNFIDSFFESLCYLENCSLSEKIDSDNNRSENCNNCDSELNDSDVSECHVFLNKLESNNESYTMASKSLMLLNWLIRDEQRRAQNLLMVLKMREKALKDFTKSQIIWLENRKKQDNTGISTLKKKQRGALLKLQYECGEMQRMRKALVALSEKRKAALLKTKKNIELKLNKDVGVDNLIQSKKKMRKLTSDRTNVPLKCFELLSSGSEHSVKSSTKSLDPKPDPVLPADTEKNVMVDGSYLNIIFQDIKLPQIFNSGKQYEVSKDPLNAILEMNKAKQNMELQILDAPIKSRETSSPSTARSLVDEFFQYYQSIGKECFSKDTSECENQMPEFKEPENNLSTSEEKLNIDIILKNLKDDSALLLEGPLPVPAGAEADVNESLNVDDNLSYDCTGEDCSAPDSEQSLEILEDTKTVSVPNLDLQNSSMSLDTYNENPADDEAENLRQQQIAIEKEIKALEQQQLIVREIPDKPPPPYTPPLEAKSRSSWRQSVLPDSKIQEYCSKAISDRAMDTDDSFEYFCYDYCHETMEMLRERKNVLPWESSQTHDQKNFNLTITNDTMIQKAGATLNEIFTVPKPPSLISGQSSRRNDLVDNILLNEWRRCEPQWTAFHAEENVAKNQVFNSIFDKVLSQTVDEYKKIVMGD